MEKGGFGEISNWYSGIFGSPWLAAREQFGDISKERTLFIFWGGRGLGFDGQPFLGPSQGHGVFLEVKLSYMRVF